MRITTITEEGTVVHRGAYISPVNSAGLLYSKLGIVALQHLVSKGDLFIADGLRATSSKATEADFEELQQDLTREIDSLLRLENAMKMLKEVNEL